MEPSLGHPPEPAADPGPGSAVSVLYAPTKVFRGLAAKPRFVIPMILLLVLGAVVGAMIFTKIDPDEQRAQMREAMEKQGQAGAELEQSVDRAAGFMQKFGPVIGGATAAFGLVVLLVVTALFWGGLRLAGSTELTFLQSLAVTFHGYMPGAIKALLTIPVLLGRETIPMAQAQGGQVLASNLSFLASEETSGPVRVLLGAVDVFSVWTIILLILGFSIVGKVSRGKAAAVVLAIWVLGLLILAGLASLQP